MKQLTTEQFEKLSGPKRRILIAQDVIAQLKAETITAEFGSYIRKLSYNNNYLNLAILSKDAQKVLCEGKLKCAACARGSLFISAVKFRNELAVDDLDSVGFSYSEDVYNTQSTKYLASDFSEKQQALIESTFEGDHFGNISGYSVEQAIRFRNKCFKAYTNLKKIPHPTWGNYLLTRICKNIIANNGTFKP